MSREIPYSPMEKRKYVSFERMQEILKKHAPQVENRGAAETTCASPISINKTSSLFWKRVNDWVIESKCGRYRIEKMVFGDKTMSFKTFRRAPDWWCHFGTESNAQVARHLCETDALESPQAK